MGVGLHKVNTSIHYSIQDNSRRVEEEEEVEGSPGQETPADSSIEQQQNTQEVNKVRKYPTACQRKLLLKPDHASAKGASPNMPVLPLLLRYLGLLVMFVCNHFKVSGCSTFC